MIKIEPLSAVNPSTYNPRTADPKRLDLIELSLRKLGFIAPIYADANGEILSGHQRHFVATRMGLKNVPVFRIPAMELQKRKALNIVFNRATNDGDICQTPLKAKRILETLNLSELANSISDKELESKEFFRCAYPCKVSVAKLCKINSGRWIQYAKSIARTLRKAGIIMPIVCTPDGKVINGIGRLEMLAELKADACDVVYISEEEAKFADAMMNLLTMDFNIHERYEDLLRYNSFRRARRVREELGHGFVFAVHGKNPCHTFDIFNPAQQAKWRKEHGNTILDFGAGHLTETNILNAAGFDCTPFEPYHIGVSEIDKGKSLGISKKFLEVVASGKEFTSVFISSVLNSVPFAKDREYIVCICAALCRPFTKLYACASSTSETGYRQVNGKAFHNESNAGNIAFRLEYESGIRIGDFQDKPKVQKYHTKKEFYELFSPFFRNVQISEMTGNVNAKCENVRRIPWERLVEALQFEFNLPYPDGSRMGLVDDAINAFKRRHEGIAV